MKVKGDTGDSVLGETMTIKQVVTVETADGSVRIDDSRGRNTDHGSQSGFVTRD